MKFQNLIYFIDNYVLFVQSLRQYESTDRVIPLFIHQVCGEIKDSQRNS